MNKRSSGAKSTDKREHAPENIHHQEDRNEEIPQRVNSLYYIVNSHDRTIAGTCGIATGVPEKHKTNQNESKKRPKKRTEKKDRKKGPKKRTEKKDRKQGPKKRTEKKDRKKGPKRIRQRKSSKTVSGNRPHPLTHPYFPRHL